MTREAKVIVLVAALLGGLLLLHAAVIQPAIDRLAALPSGPPLEPEASYPPPMDVADIYAHFVDPAEARSFGESVGLSVKSAGGLVLPTGRVVAGDVHLFGSTTFTRQLPAGKQEVVLLQLEREGAAALGDYREVAAAMVRVGPGDPVRWEPALVAGQDPAELGPDEFFGYPVDSGTGCFMSHEAAAMLEAGRFPDYADEVQRQMFPSEDEFRNVANVVVDPASGLNVIAFPSGYGDGAYPSYFGLDEAGRPLVLLTDFTVLDAPAAD